MVRDAHELAGVAEGIIGKNATPKDRSVRDVVHLIKKKLGAALHGLADKYTDRTDDELLQEHLTSVQARVTGSTLNHKKVALQQYLDFLKGKPLADADFRDVRRFADHLAKKNLRERTIASYIADVRRFHRFLSQYYGFDHVDADDIRASDYRHKVPSAHERQPLSREEMRQLARAARAVRDRLIILFFYYTWIRVSELANLKLSDVGTGSGMVKVREGKGRKDRWVKYKVNDLSTLVEIWLKRDRKSYPGADGNDWFFVSRGDRKLSAKAIRRIVHSVAERVGIQEVVGRYADGRSIYRVTPHVIRHTGASHANEDGVKFDHIQGQLGHNHPRTTAIYVHNSPERMFDSYENFRGIGHSRRKSERR